MFFDGVVNAKGVGIGAILISPTGQHYPATTWLWFFCTNNTAEYEACIMGMNMAIDQDVEELLIMGDSNLIIRQAQGEWETRDVKIIPYKQHVEDLRKRFKSVEFKYIPRFYNELVVALATLASMLLYPVEVETDVQPWYHYIKRFLKTKEYPEQASGDQKRTIKRLAGGFFLSGEVLYKKTPDLNHLRCVDAQEAAMIMNEVHAGVHGDMIHAPPSELHPMSAPWPFVAWGMDVIGHLMREVCEQFKIMHLNSTPYRPKANGDVEAANKNIKKILRKMIQSSRQWHEKLPSANLNSHLMRKVCEHFKIMHWNSTPYRPKANGAVEAANKNIKKILRKMIQSSRQWHEKLPFALSHDCAHIS
ncbi:uncharacterized protein [Nicotiana sylvestris]|uniref:uncharacterized protein n=1 Tax=Nicotiana sylvestris TaxID=4096 RepID=UPI00388C608C